jgi:hypothetical protein
MCVSMLVFSKSIKVYVLVLFLGRFIRNMCFSAICGCYKDLELVVRCSYSKIADSERGEYVFSVLYSILVHISAFLTCNNGLFTEHHARRQPETLQ